MTNIEIEDACRSAALQGTGRVTLEVVHERHLNFLVELDQRPATIEFERDRAQSVDEITRHYRALIGRQPDEKSVHLVVRLADSPTLVGRVRLVPLNSEIGEFETGWASAEEFWGRGYMTEAVTMVLKYAFRSLKAHRVVAFCDSLNTRSERLMIRVGMTREGKIRETKRLGESWHDELVYSMLDGESESRLS